MITSHFFQTMVQITHVRNGGKGPAYYYFLNRKKKFFNTCSWGIEATLAILWHFGQKKRKGGDEVLEFRSGNEWSTGSWGRAEHTWQQTLVRRLDTMGHSRHWPTGPCWKPSYLLHLIQIRLQQHGKSPFPDNVFLSKSLEGPAYFEAACLPCKLRKSPLHRSGSWEEKLQ